MKSSIRILLLVFAVIALLHEAFLGIPILGGSYILSTGWGALGFNMVIYLIVALVIFGDRNNEAKEIVYIPILGIILNIIAVIPFIGMFIHWIMTFMMIYFIVKLLSYREYIGDVKYYDSRRAGDTVNQTHRD